MHRPLVFGFVGGIVFLFALPIVFSIPSAAQGLPDLTADGWLDHEPVIEGYPYVLTLAIWNVGEVAASNFTVLMQYSGHGGPELLRVTASEPLLPGEKRVVRTVGLTGSQGTIGFGIMMDYYTEIAESNETNNQVSRSWDGISPGERPILRATLYGNGSRSESLPTESTMIYDLYMRRDDLIRFRVTGPNASQPFDVFLFVGQTNLNTYFGFGNFSPEIAHRGITTTQGEFQARENETVFLVVDNLSDGPYPPWPKPLNFIAVFEIERAPPPPSPPASPPVGTPAASALGSIFVIAIVGGVTSVAIATVGYLWLQSRPATPRAPHHVRGSVHFCPFCGTPATAPANFCIRCGGRLPG